MFRVLFVDAYVTRGDWGLAWAHIEPAIAEVVAIGQPMSIAGVAMAVLEPKAMLGQWPRAAPLLAALDHDALAQSPQAGSELWLACAVAALLRDDTAEAGAWLQRPGPPAAIENPRIRQRLLLVDAQRRWREGDTAGALAQLPADDAPGMNDELRLRALALALRCHTGADPAGLARARAALDDPRAMAPPRWSWRRPWAARYSPGGCSAWPPAWPMAPRCRPASALSGAEPRRRNGAATGCADIASTGTTVVPEAAGRFHVLSASRQTEES